VCPFVSGIHACSTAHSAGDLRNSCSTAELCRRRTIIGAAHRHQTIRPPGTIRLHHPQTVSTTLEQLITVTCTTRGLVRTGSEAERLSICLACIGCANLTWPRAVAGADEETCIGELAGTGRSARDRYCTPDSCRARHEHLLLSSGKSRKPRHVTSGAWRSPGRRRPPPLSSSAHPDAWPRQTLPGRVLLSRAHVGP